jgi:hypothetical protein
VENVRLDHGRCDRSAHRKRVDWHRKGGSLETIRGSVAEVTGLNARTAAPSRAVELERYERV